MIPRLPEWNAAAIPIGTLASAVSGATAAALHRLLDEQKSAGEASRQASILVLMLSTPEWMVM